MDRIVRGIPWLWAALVVALVATGDTRAQESLPGTDSAKPQAAVAEATPEAGSEQIVVLRDGGVLSGRATLSGERYVLARGTGEVLIPVNNVMLIAASLEDAYQQRRQRLGQPTAEEHLILAEWCLRCDLNAHAERELVDARALDAHDDKLMMLERRLALAKERSEKQAAAPATSRPRPTESQLTERVQTALSDLPEGAVELFTRRVQPVLVNSCTTTGCHQSGGAEKFQLDRAILRGLSNRRSTMNNLAEALALVDREQPQLSLLLTMPRRTHGGMKRPVFGPRQDAAFRHLEEWVALVTRNTSTPSPANRADEGVELIGAKGDQPSRWESPVMRVERTQTSESEQAVYQESSPPDVSAGDEAAQAAADPGTVNASPLRYGARLKRWHPRDPFDPEIFNRQYAPRSNSIAGAKKIAVSPMEKPEPSSDLPVQR
jgi:hypothetical protein